MASRLRFADRLLPYAVGCLIALGIAFLLGSIEHNYSAEVNTCQQVQKLSGAIQTTLKRELGTLGKRGAPGYAYYHDHPAELAASRLQLQQQVTQFAPKHC